MNPDDLKMRDLLRFFFQKCLQDVLQLDEKQSLKMGRFSSLPNTFLTHTHKKNTHIHSENHLLPHTSNCKTSNEICRADLLEPSGSFFHASWRWMTCQTPRAGVGRSSYQLKFYHPQFHHGFFNDDWYRLAVQTSQYR